VFGIGDGYLLCCVCVLLFVSPGEQIEDWYHLNVVVLVWLGVWCGRRISVVCFAVCVTGYAD